MSNLPSIRPRQEIGSLDGPRRVTLVSSFARWLDLLRNQVDRLTEESIPSGSIISTLATDEPEKWLFCNGQAVSKKSYPDLFAVIGTTYGSTSTTFNLPDLSDRFLVGAGAIANKAYGGSDTITLTTANLPAHNHPVTDPGHAHTFTGTPHNHTITDPGHTHTNAVVSGTARGTTAGSTIDTGDTGSSTTGITVDNATAGGSNSTETTGITVGDTGSGTAFNNTPPALGVQWLIRT